MGKTIIHVLNTGSYSGAENVVISIIEGFRDQNNEDIRFIYTSLYGTIREVLEERNIEFEPLKRLTVIGLKKVIRKYRPDIIHAHDFTASIISVLASGKVPVISHIHNNSPWIGNYCVNSFVYGMSCLKYKQMLGVSASVFEEFVFGKYFSRKEKIVGNPINIAAIKQKALLAEDKMTYDIVFLGRISQPKNPFLFLEIIRDVCKKKKISAVMIGNGELFGEIKAKIEEYNLQHVITMKGFIENPYGILANSKILCIPSLWEGFGLVAAEAMAVGIPVVASSVGGLSEIVNNNCGKLCFKKDEYVDEIIQLMENEDVYIEKSRQSYIRAMELDNMESYLDGLINIYEGL